MWSRITGKSNDKDEDRSSQPSRRKSDAHTSQPRRRSGSESIVSSTSSRRPARGDDRDRGFNPTSTSYATSSRSPYPATASASIASSYATASSNRPDDSILPPGLIRNASLADKVARSGEGREERDTPRGSDRRRTRSTSRERKHRKHRSRSREPKDSKQDKKEYREKKDRRGEVDRGVSVSEDIHQDTNRAGEVPTYGSASFNAQVGSSNFSQFPGQFDGGVSGFVASPSQATPAPPHPPANFSSHVPDQFPGQFPNQSSAPYRPPLSAKEGGPGLASEYYGDAGESVVHQPGVRPKPPDLIIGAEPHLMAASPISAPPPEPSASGGVGAAAAYFTSSGTNDTYQQTSSPSFRPLKPDKPSRPGTASRPGKSSSLSGPVMTAGGAALGYAAAGSNESSKYNPSTGSNSTSFYQQGPNPVVSGAIGYASQNVTSNSQDSHHSTSAPVIPTVGAAAPGAAAGYINGHEGSSSRPPQNQSYHQPESISGDAGSYLPGYAQRPGSKTTTYVISSSGRASKVGKHSSESNVPLYAAGAVGAAGLAAAAHHQHHSSSHSSVSSSPYPSGQMKLSTPSRTRVGPLEKFVNFWKDHEGVARFEEYTQYIGVCKYCFSPDSSPRDAPRKHHYRRRGSQSKYGSSTRIDKESRYFSSDSDNRRKSGKSWLATGIAGYGLAKVGRSIMSQGRDSDDIYSAKSGRTRRSTTSLGGRSEISTRRSSHRSRSNDRFETGITSDGKVYKKDNHAGSLGGSHLVTVDPSRHRSRSRSGSRSHDQHSGLAGAALGAAIGTSAAGSRSRRRSTSQSPDKSFVRKKRRSRETSPTFGSMFGFAGSRKDRSGRRSSSSSYVDISSSKRNTKSGVLGGFFNAPSEKRTETRRKKKKGFFAWGNGSSSSSNSDLAFGGGFARRSQSREHRAKERDRRDTEAIIGLGAAAAALAANGNRKGKRDGRRADVVAIKGSKSKQTRDYRNDYGSGTSPPSHDEAWESAPDDDSDDSSSANSGLAFGGVYGDAKQVARRSQDSLASESSGTSKWGWRWGSKKKKNKDSTYPKQSVQHENSFAVPAMAGMAGAAAGAALASDRRQDGAMSSTTSLPPLQHVYPLPTSDPTNFDVSRHDSMSSTQTQPLITSRPAPVPLQQPQPIAPVSSTVYTSQPQYHPSYSAPSGPPVFAQGSYHTDPISQPPQAHWRDNRSSNQFGTESLPSGRDERSTKPLRRGSSPTFYTAVRETNAGGGKRRASTKDQAPGVRFGLTEEQAEKEKRDNRRREKEVAEREERVRLREAEEQAQLDQEKERSRLQRERDEYQRVKERDQTARRAQEQHDREQREIEFDKAQRRAESNRDRRISPNQEDPQQANAQSVSWAAPVAAGAFGAAVGSAMAKNRSEKPSEGQQRPQSTSEPAEGYDQVRNEKITGAKAKETDRQVQIARKAASKVIAKHEDYAAYFTPPELMNKSNEQALIKGPNADNDIMSYHIPEIITIAPPNHPPYPPAYTFAMTKDGIDSSQISFPWAVPKLNLIQPTPPASVAGSVRATSPRPPSPVLEPDEIEEATPGVAQPTSISSNVATYDPILKEYVYDVPRAASGSIKTDTTPLHESMTVEDITDDQPPVRGDRDPVSDAKASHVPGAFEDDTDFAATLAAGLKDSGFDPSIVIEDSTYRRRTSPPGPESIDHRRQDASHAHAPSAHIYGDDLDFAATLAAGLQDTGFDPSIVVEDPTYHRRESPPRSEQQTFYARPFAQTVTDLGLYSPGTEGAPPQQGFVEGEVAPTPKAHSTRHIPDDYFGDAEIKAARKERKPGGEQFPQAYDDTPPTVAAVPPEAALPGKAASAAPTKLNKKEQRKKDRARKSSENDAVTVDEMSSTPKQQIVQPEASGYTEDPKDFNEAIDSEKIIADVGPRDINHRTAQDDMSVLPGSVQDDYPELQSKRGKKAKRNKDAKDQEALSGIGYVASPQANQVTPGSTRRSLDSDPRDVEPTRAPAAAAAAAAAAPAGLPTMTPVESIPSSVLPNEFVDPETAHYRTAYDANIREIVPSTSVPTTTFGEQSSYNDDVALYNLPAPQEARKAATEDTNGHTDRRRSVEAAVPVSHYLVDEFPQSQPTSWEDRGENVPAQVSNETPIARKDETNAHLKDTSDNSASPTKSNSKTESKSKKPRCETFEAAPGAFPVTPQEDREEPSYAEGRASKMSGERYVSEEEDSGFVAPDMTRSDSDDRKKSRNKLDRDEADSFESPFTDVRSVVAEPAQDDFEEPRRTKSKKSKRHSLPYESPARESVSVATSDPGRHETDEPRKSKRSKRRTVEFDDAASVATAPTTFDDNEDLKRTKKEKKGGFFGLFGGSKSSETGSESRKSRGTPREAIFDDFEEPKQRSKRRSGDRTSSGKVYDISGDAAQSVSNVSEFSSTKTNGRSRNDDDGHRSHKSRDREDKRRSREESGRNTQDQELKKDPSLTGVRGTPDVTDAGDIVTAPASGRSEALPDFIDNPQELLSSGERPILPAIEPEDAIMKPSPSQTLDDKESSTELTANSLGPPTLANGTEELPPLPLSPPNSPTTEDEPNKRRPSSIHTPDRIQTLIAPPKVASPTAIPIHFRKPRPLSWSARSSPQTSPSGPDDSPVSGPRQRGPRPTSTEFRTSSEFRPLWLVERHSSRQVVPQVEYPPLPESRSASESTSLADPDENPLIADTENRLRSDPTGLGISSESNEALQPSSIEEPGALAQRSASSGSADESNQVQVAALSPPSSPSRIVHSVKDLFPDHKSVSQRGQDSTASGELPSLPLDEHEAPTMDSSKAELEPLNASVDENAVGTIFGSSATAAANTFTPGKVISETLIEERGSRHSLHDAPPVTDVSTNRLVTPPEELEQPAMARSSSKKKDKKAKKQAKADQLSFQEPPSTSAEEPFPSVESQRAPDQFQDAGKPTVIEDPAAVEPEVPVLSRLDSKKSKKGRKRGSTISLDFTQQPAPDDFALSVHGASGVLDQGLDLVEEPYIADLGSVEPDRPALSRSNSRKDKKSKKQSKGNKPSTPDIIPNQNERESTKDDLTPGIPSAEEQRQLQEKDAQDAVDSWFDPPSPTTFRKGKKGKKRGQSISTQEYMPPVPASNTPIPASNAKATADIEELTPIIPVPSTARETDKEATRQVKTQDSISSEAPGLIQPDVQAVVAEPPMTQVSDALISPLTHRNPESATTELKTPAIEDDWQELAAKPKNGEGKEKEDQAATVPSLPDVRSAEQGPATGKPHEVPQTAPYLIAAVESAPQSRADAIVDAIPQHTAIDPKGDRSMTSAPPSDIPETDLDVDRAADDTPQSKTEDIPDALSSSVAEASETGVGPNEYLPQELPKTHEDFVATADNTSQELTRDVAQPQSIPDPAVSQKDLKPEPTSLQGDTSLGPQLAAAAEVASQRSTESVPKALDKYFSEPSLETVQSPREATPSEAALDPEFVDTAEHPSAVNTDEVAAALDEHAMVLSERDVTSGSKMIPSYPVHDVFVEASEDTSQVRSQHVRKGMDELAATVIPEPQPPSTSIHDRIKPGDEFAAVAENAAALHTEEVNQALNERAEPLAQVSQYGEIPEPPYIRSASPFNTEKDPYEQVHHEELQTSLAPQRVIPSSWKSVDEPELSPNFHSAVEDLSQGRTEMVSSDLDTPAKHQELVNPALAAMDGEGTTLPQQRKVEDIAIIGESLPTSEALPGSENLTADNASSAVEDQPEPELNFPGRKKPKGKRRQKQEISPEQDLEAPIEPIIRDLPTSVPETSTAVEPEPEFFQSSKKKSKAKKTRKQVSFSEPALEVRSETLTEEMGETRKAIDEDVERSLQGQIAPTSNDWAGADTQQAEIIPQLTTQEALTAAEPEEEFQKPSKKKSKGKKNRGGANLTELAPEIVPQTTSQGTEGPLEAIKEDVARSLEGQKAPTGDDLVEPITKAPEAISKAALEEASPTVDPEQEFEVPGKKKSKGKKKRSQISWNEPVAQATKEETPSTIWESHVGTVQDVAPLESQETPIRASTTQATAKLADPVISVEDNPTAVDPEEEFQVPGKNKSKGKKKQKPMHVKPESLLPLEETTRDAVVQNADAQIERASQEFPAFPVGHVSGDDSRPSQPLLKDDSFKPKSVETPQAVSVEEQVDKEVERIVQEYPPISTAMDIAQSEDVPSLPAEPEFPEAPHLSKKKAKDKKKRKQASWIDPELEVSLEPAFTPKSTPEPSIGQVYSAVQEADAGIARALEEFPPVAANKNVPDAHTMASDLNVSDAKALDAEVNVQQKMDEFPPVSTVLEAGPSFDFSVPTKKKGKKGKEAQREVEDLPSEDVQIPQNDAEQGDTTKEFDTIKSPLSMEGVEKPEVKSSIVENVQPTFAFLHADAAIENEQANKHIQTTDPKLLQHGVAAPALETHPETVPLPESDDHDLDEAQHKSIASSLVQDPGFARYGANADSQPLADDEGRSSLLKDENVELSQVTEPSLVDPINLTFQPSNADSGTASLHSKADAEVLNRSMPIDDTSTATQAVGGIFEPPQLRDILLHTSEPETTARSLGTKADPAIFQDSVKDNDQALKLPRHDGDKSDRLDEPSPESVPLPLGDDSDLADFQEKLRTNEEQLSAEPEDRETSIIQPSPLTEYQAAQLITESLDDKAALSGTLEGLDQKYTPSSVAHDSGTIHRPEGLPALPKQLEAPISTKPVLQASDHTESLPISADDISIAEKARPDSQAEVDEPALTSSKKKAKKGKKQKLPFNEPNLEQEYSATLTGPLSVKEVGFDQPKPEGVDEVMGQAPLVTERDDVGLEMLKPVEEAPAPAVEDEQSGFTTKKKGKKSKKERKAFSNLDEVPFVEKSESGIAQVTQDISQLGAVEETPSTADVPPGASEPPLQSSLGELEPMVSVSIPVSESWDTPSKKNGKKAKTMKQQQQQDVPELSHIPSDTAALIRENETPVEAKDFSDPIQSSRTLERDSAGDLPPLQSKDRVVTPEGAEELWALPSSKKAKKGKKGKIQRNVSREQSTGTSTPANEPEPIIEIAAAAIESEPKEEVQRDLMNDKSVAPPENIERPSTDAEELWALPSKKKARKGKKAKPQEDPDFNEKMNTSIPAVQDELPEPNLAEPSNIPIQPLVDTAKHASNDVIASESMATQEVPKPYDEESWVSPVTKKGKKGKKGRSQQEPGLSNGSSTHAIANEPGDEIASEPFVERSQSPGVLKRNVLSGLSTTKGEDVEHPADDTNDRWAEPIPKKGKKGKKSKQQQDIDSGTGTTNISTPAPELPSSIAETTLPEIEPESSVRESKKDKKTKKQPVTELTEIVEGIVPLDADPERKPSPYPELPKDIEFHPQPTDAPAHTQVITPSVTERTVPAQDVLPHPMTMPRKEHSIEFADTTADQRFLEKENEQYHAIPGTIMPTDIALQSALREPKPKEDNPETSGNVLEKHVSFPEVGIATAIPQPDIPAEPLFETQSGIGDVQSPQANQPYVSSPLPTESGMHEELEPVSPVQEPSTTEPAEADQASEANNLPEFSLKKSKMNKKKAKKAREADTNLDTITPDEQEALLSNPKSTPLSQDTIIPEIEADRNPFADEDSHEAAVYEATLARALAEPGPSLEQPETRVASAQGVVRDPAEVSSVGPLGSPQIRDQGPDQDPYPSVSAQGESNVLKEEAIFVDELGYKNHFDDPIVSGGPLVEPGERTREVSAPSEQLDQEIHTNQQPRDLVNEQSNIDSVTESFEQVPTGDEELSGLTTKKKTKKGKKTNQLPSERETGADDSLEPKATKDEIREVPTILSDVSSSSLKPEAAGGLESLSSIQEIKAEQALPAIVEQTQGLRPSEAAVQSPQPGSPTPQIDEEIDEEASGYSSKKKGKKSKKQQKGLSRKAEDVVNTTALNTLNESQGVKEPALEAPLEQEQEPYSALAPKSLTEPEIDVEPDDEAVGYGIKKKGRKSRNKARSLNTDDASNKGRDEVEVPSVAETVQEATTEAPQMTLNEAKDLSAPKGPIAINDAELTSTQTNMPDVHEAQDDFGTYVTKKGKKGKKGKRQRPDAIPDFEGPKEAVVDMPSVPEAEGTISGLTTIEPTLEPTVSKSDEALAALEVPRELTEVSTPREGQKLPDVDDFSTFTTKKKGRKGKSSRKQSQASTPLPEVESPLPGTDRDIEGVSRLQQAPEAEVASANEAPKAEDFEAQPTGEPLSISPSNEPLGQAVDPIPIDSKFRETAQLEQQSPVASIFPGLRRVSAKPPPRRPSVSETVPRRSLSLSGASGVSEKKKLFDNPVDVEAEPSGPFESIDRLSGETFSEPATKPLNSAKETGSFVQSIDQTPERALSDNVTEATLQEPTAYTEVPKEAPRSFEDMTAVREADDRNMPGDMVPAAAAATLGVAAVIGNEKSKKSRAETKKSKKQKKGLKALDVEDDLSQASPSRPPASTTENTEQSLDLDAARSSTVLPESALISQPTLETAEPETDPFEPVQPEPKTSESSRSPLTSPKLDPRISKLGLHPAEESRYADDMDISDFEPTGTSQKGVQSGYRGEKVNQNRDSALHVTDSPMLPNASLARNVVRDSGFHDNGVSPVVRQSDETSLNSRPITPQPSNTARQISPSAQTTRPITPIGERSSASLNTLHQSATNTSSSDEQGLNISVELDPSYELSVSRRHHPRSEQQSSNNSDRSLDFQWQPPDSTSGIAHSEQTRGRRLTPARSMEDFPEPSPVDSTTKDRDSMLFESSPAFTERPHEHAGDISAYAHHGHGDYQSPHNDEGLQFGVAESEEPSFGKKRGSSKSKERGLSSQVDPSPFAQDQQPSLFGGPLGVNSDRPVVQTPTRGTPGYKGSERASLNTITEQSPEESPLHRKKSRTRSDVGSPPHALKAARRMGTPQQNPHKEVQAAPSQPSGLTPSTDPRSFAGDPKFISTDELISRLSWPSVDENEHTVDIERVKSRDTDRRSRSRHSNSPAITGDPLKPRDIDRRSASGQSVRSTGSAKQYRTPDREQIRSASGLSDRSGGTPPLRRVTPVSGDLRAANKRSQAKLAKDNKLELTKPELEHDQLDPLESSSSIYDPVNDKGKGRARGMADVYEGWGDVHGSPLSPTRDRPPSMRRRQSTQILDLESRLDQLVSENRLLANAKIAAEKGLQDAAYEQNRTSSALSEAIETRDLQLREKDAEIEQLKELLQRLQQEVSRLSGVNHDLTEANISLNSNQDERWHSLQAEHSTAIRELENLRQQHGELSTGMEDIVRHEINTALEEKNAELKRLRDELNIAKEQVRTLQQEILASKPKDNFLVIRDDDYFDNACQKLCQHVQQWVLRFSKFSDMTACHLASEIADEKVVDRFENAILDGSDVDKYLSDRVKRRDVFMSVVMTMIWEYIFTRYLFGMDREQRQKLKSLEKTLSEVGPPSAISNWRATTLTLLSLRPAFTSQRTLDTEAVVQEIYQTLSLFLPPPQHLESQILTSLRNVLRSAVDLSIEMRTQREEYIMLPPLQPEYDTRGELVRKVRFNAGLMNERGGETFSNEELETKGAVVQMVLFPLVVRRSLTNNSSKQSGGSEGSSEGDGREEEVVVCPAQVLVARPPRDKRVVRVLSAESESGRKSELGVLEAGRKSGLSVVPEVEGSDVGMGGMI